MNNSTQAFADGKFPAPDSNPAATCSPANAHIPEADNIRQAQREWRLAKRRELDAKARKKIRRASLSTPNVPATQQLPHTQPPHVHATTLYSQIPTANPTSPHQVHIAHGAVFVPPNEVQQLHVQSMAQPQPVSTAALHQVNQPHPSLTSPLKPDPEHAMVVSAALQTHLNANAKRPRSAMEETVASSAVDDAEGVAAANAAAVHAAASASPGDAQFANTIPMPTGVGAVVAAPIVTDAHLQEQQDAHQRAMRQFEAQRKWREMKRKEIAMKKAKGAGSKRGRKKSRVDVIEPAHSAATAHLQASVSMAIAAVPPSIGTPAVQVDMPAEDSKGASSNGLVVAANGQGVDEDPTAVYVGIASTAEPAKDVGESDEAMKDIGNAIEEGMPTSSPQQKTGTVSMMESETLSREQTSGETSEHQGGKREDQGPTKNATDQAIADAGGQLTASNGDDHDDGVVVDSSAKPKDGSPVHPIEQSASDFPNLLSKPPVEEVVVQTIDQAMDETSEQPENQAMDQSSEHPVDMEMPTSDEADIAAQRLAEAAEQSARAQETAKHPDGTINLNTDEAGIPEDQSKATMDAAKHVSEAPELVASPLPQGESKDAPKAGMQDAKCQMINVDDSKANECTGEKNVNDKSETEEVEGGISEGVQPKQHSLEGEKRVRDGTGDRKDLPLENSEQKTRPSIQSGAETSSIELGGTESASGQGAQKEKGDSPGECTNTARRGESQVEGKQFNDALETRQPSDEQRTQDNNSVHDGEAEVKTDEFAGVNGEDIMTAAAWQSLDSISNP